MPETWTWEDRYYKRMKIIQWINTFGPGNASQYVGLSSPSPFEFPLHAPNSTSTTSSAPANSNTFAHADTASKRRLPHHRAQTSN